MAHQVPDSWGARRRQVGGLDLLHQRPESLGQRGVNADGPLEQRESAGQHHGVEDLHQLATLCAQDGRPQDVVGFSAPWFVGLRISACGSRLSATVQASPDTSGPESKILAQEHRITDVATMMTA